ncbi:hypothetical protein NM688_g5420 [Phlebia brevispora]|uniref:Uncharacterized protein n=1 Tax=Phlebia brevispora TaxID=194682 RepID=A0ACC1SVK2_9APHY|nr:hypothetical protein NM688_g5420 [Phlebia brevispora]
MRRAWLRAYQSADYEQGEKGHGGVITPQRHSWMGHHHKVYKVLCVPAKFSSFLASFTLTHSLYTMGWFDSSSSQAQSYDQWNNTDVNQHDPSAVHELLAGAASYEAAKAYENHCAQNGQPPSHEEAKELLAGVSGAFVDREVETRGLNFVDKEKAKYEARRQTQQAYDQNCY